MFAAHAVLRDDWEPTPLSLRGAAGSTVWCGGPPWQKFPADQDDENTIETRISPLMRGVSSDTVSLWRRTRRSTLAEPSRRSRKITSSKNAGKRGLHSRVSPLNGSNCRPSDASNSGNGVALAQAG